MGYKYFLSRRWAIAAIVLAAFAALSYISVVIFCDYPFSMDEYNYLYQAKIFASGRMYLNADGKLRELFEVYTIFLDGKLFSKYPAGFSLILSLGERLGFSGFVNPLISAGTLFVIYLLGAELAGSLFSLLGVVIIASSSYFLGYGASYFSHPAVLFFSSLGFLFYQKCKSLGKNKFLYFCALAIGAVVFIRPLDAFCLWLALSFGFLRAKLPGKFRTFFLFCILSAWGAAALVIYNKILTGKYGIVSYSVWGSDFKILYGKKSYMLPPMENFRLFLNIYMYNIKALFYPLLTKYFLPYIACWAPFIALSFYCFKQAGDKFKSLRAVFLFYCFLVIAVYNITPSVLPQYPSWPQYGARYWYILIAPLAIFIIDGIRALRGIAPKRVFLFIFTACIIAQAWQVVRDFDKYSQRFKFVQETREDINRSCPEKSIIFLRASPNFEKEAPFFVRWSDFKRNPFLNAKRLYLISGKNIDAIRAHYPDYSVCNYSFGAQK